MPVSSHHAVGPGQHEVDFKYGDPLTSADNITTYKWVVRTIAAKNGLYASFAPKPLHEKTGNIHRIIISPYKNGTFKTDPDISDRFISGILSHISEMTAFINPSDQSYARLANYSGDSHIIRTQTGSSEYEKIIICTSDPALNPYIAYTLLITAGLYGIENNAMVDIEKLNRMDTLPCAYNKAIKTACESDFIRSILPDEAIEAYKNKYNTANI
jgi:glutamine synthetase